MLKEISFHIQRVKWGQQCHGLTSIESHVHTLFNVQCSDNAIGNLPDLSFETYTGSRENQTWLFTAIVKTKLRDCFPKTKVSSLRQEMGSAFTSLQCPIDKDDRTILRHFKHSLPQRLFEQRSLLHAQTTRNQHAAMAPPSVNSL